MSNLESPHRARARRFALDQVGQVTVRASQTLDFSTEDEVPGLMWLPTGLRDVSTGDPWVTMCLVDYKHYQVGDVGGGGGGSGGGSMLYP